MKFSCPLLFAAALVPGIGQAQVTINPAALAQLAGLPVARPVLAELHPARVTHPVTFRVRSKVAEKKPTWEAPVAKLIVAKPAPPPAPPPAPKQPAPLPPVRILFAPGSATLPAGAAASLKPWCAAPGPIAIDAHAPADPADASAAMRLSLARALAVRDALTACGVPGTEILPRALGAAAGQNEDETMLGGAKTEK